MSSDFGPQRQQNLRRNLAQATKLYCYRNILMNNNNWFLYSLVVCLNQKIPLGLNNAHMWKTNGYSNCSCCYLVGFYWLWHLVEGILLLHIIKSLKKKNARINNTFNVTSPLFIFIIPCFKFHLLSLCSSNFTASVVSRAENLIEHIRSAIMGPPFVVCKNSTSKKDKSGPGQTQIN